MAPDDALDALERVPAAEPLVAIASLDLRRVQRAAHPALAALLRPLAEPQAPPAPSAAAAAANGAAQSHAPAVAPRELLMEEVARVLGIDGASLDLQTPLADLGFDSMMAIHVRHAVMSRLGIDLPFSALLAGQTFEEMAAVLAARLPAQPVAEAAADATAWEVGSL
jgi:acyl carrier protein